MAKVLRKKKKRPGHRERDKPRHAKFTTGGPGTNTKTRPDVPSTPENKAATGKQVGSKGGTGGRDCGKG